MTHLGQKKVLDHGYVEFVESWGSDESIIEAARMSTNKGFQGWGTEEKPGDEKLLKYLYNNKHMSPFEMGGLTLEIKAPIFVFREWHRHRTQCLAPDTLIHFNAPKSKKNRKFIYKLSIENLWKKWQPTKKTARPERQTNSLWPRSRIQEMHLRCLDENTGEIITTRIVDIIKGDLKPMIRVTTASGKSVTATREHRFFTNLGWKTLGEAVDQNLLLTVEASRRNKLARWERPPISSEKEIWKTIPNTKNLYEASSEGRIRRTGCEPKKLVKGAQQYDVVSISIEGRSQARTVHRLVLETFKGPCPLNGEGRHLNHNRGDNRLENLEWGNSKENSRDMTEADRQQRLISELEEIVSVTDAGTQQSYDISVAGPFHNFLADGFVVHNSYNEMSARYTPIPDENYIPTVERLMMNSKTNKQAGRVDGAEDLTEEAAEGFRMILQDRYEEQQCCYESALKAGVPKELARIVLPVGRYSKMRASANLRNWLAFLTLRMDKGAQWEIREYANVVCDILWSRFPRTMELFDASR